MICDLLRIIRFFYAALGDVRKRGAKGAGLSVVWFLGGDGQITGIDVLPVIDRHLRADLKKRGFARKASLTQCAGMAWKLLKKSMLIIGRAFDDKKK